MGCLFGHERNEIAFSGLGWNPRHWEGWTSGAWIKTDHIARYVV